MGTHLDKEFVFSALVSGDGSSEVIDDQHEDCADHRDEHAPQIEAGDPRTNMLHRLKPVIPVLPKYSNSRPPTMPSRILRKNP
jgi:hypothetical protein